MLKSSFARGRLRVGMIRTASSVEDHVLDIPHRFPPVTLRFVCGRMNVKVNALQFGNDFPINLCTEATVRALAYGVRHLVTPYRLREYTIGVPCCERIVVECGGVSAAFDVYAATVVERHGRIIIVCSRVCAATT